MTDPSTLSTLLSSPVRSPASPRANRLTVMAVILIVVLMLGRLWWIPAHAPLNVNEGWNAGQVLRAFGAGPLYPAPDALIGNNYPPLSFFLVGAAGWLIGDAIIAGRILALAAQAATGWAILVIVTRLAGPRWAKIALLLFGGFAVTLLRSYLGINDPQWLGHAAMSWALVLLTPRRPGGHPTPRHIVAAAALIVVGALIKHNLVALPLAITVWLWITDRRAFWIWVTAGAALALLACGTLLAIWGTTIFIDVLTPARSYSVVRMAAKGGPLMLALLPAVLTCRPLLGAWRDDPRLALPGVLLAVALPIGIVQRAGDGVDVNAFFEAIIAMCIAIPVACALRPHQPFAWLAITILPILCLLPFAAIQTIGELGGRDAAVRRWQPFVTAIATAPGPVACDDQAVCYWAGRHSALDFFSVKQRLLKGRAKRLIPALERAHFAMIEMRGANPGWHENLLIPAIRAHYRTVYSADGIELLTPLPRGRAQPMPPGAAGSRPAS